MNATAGDMLILPRVDISRRQINALLWGLMFGMALMFGLGLTLHYNLMDRQAKVYQDALNAKKAIIESATICTGKFLWWDGEKFGCDDLGRKK